MLQDGLIFIDGASGTNFQVQRGTTLPVTGLNTGELFYLTSGSVGLYVYSGSDWVAVGSGGGGGGPITEGDITDGSILARVASNETISGNWTFTGAAHGQTPTVSSHFTTKDYVDSVAAGLFPHEAVRVGTTANITLSGTQTIDGVLVAVGNRVLVKNQSTGSQNGVYVVASGAWTRATDFDNSPDNEVESGDFVFVLEGTVNENSGWVLTTSGSIILGTTALTFVKLAGAVGGGGASVGGSNTQIQFNNSGVLDGIPGFTFNSASGALLYYIGDVASPDQSALVGAGSAASTAGEFKILGGETQTGIGGAATISGGAAFSSGGAGGAVTVSGGGVNSGSGNAGSVGISGGFASGSGLAGNVVINGGTGTNAGFISLRTSNAERLRITALGSVDFSNRYIESRSLVTSTASTSLNLATSNNFVITMATNISVLAFTNVSATGLHNMTLFIVQDATGSRTITWPAAVRWQGGSAPTLTTTANRIDVITLVSYNGGVTWLGFVAGQNYPA